MLAARDCACFVVLQLSCSQLLKDFTVNTSNPSNGMADAVPNVSEGPY